MKTIQWRLEWLSWSSVAAVAAILTMSAHPLYGDLLLNSAFEDGPNGGGAPDDWTVTGDAGQESWAGESGDGVAFRTWVTPAAGTLYQNVAGDTNAQYYFRYRSHREGSVTNLQMRGEIAFYDSSGSFISSTTNLFGKHPNSGSWTSFTINAAAPGNMATVRVTAAFTSTNTDIPFATATRVDNATLYDRTLNYRVGEIVEEFSYDPHASMTNQLDGKDRGGNFTNNWVESSAGSFAISDGSFSQVTGYPQHRGNKVVVNPPSAGSRHARRHFEPITNGQIYGSFIVNYEFGETPGGGDGKFAGMSFMSNDVEKLFFGELGSADKTNGISFGGADLTGGFDLNAGGGNDYIIFAKYDFASRSFYTHAYNVGDPVPSAEPNWSVTGIVAVGRAKEINAVRIAAGAGSGTPGNCFFDEVRVATNWNQLLGLDAPVATSLVVNAGMEVTDADVAAGTFDVVMHLVNAAGMESTNYASPYYEPNFDLLNDGGTEVLTDEVFETFSYLDNGTVVIATDTTHVGVDPGSIDLGDYTVRWSAIASNQVGATNSFLLIGGSNSIFRVVDDDTNHPTAGLLSIFDMPLAHTDQYTDAELADGFRLSMILDDDTAVNVTNSTGGKFIPNLDLLNPAGDLIVDSVEFDRFSTPIILNSGFETGLVNQGVAAHWGGSHGLLLRTNTYAHSGSYSMGEDYNGSTNYSENVWQYFDISNVASGETFTFGGWIFIDGVITGGQALIKMEWWTAPHTNAGSFLGFALGDFVDSTTGRWQNIEVTATKTNDIIDYVRCFIEVAHFSGGSAVSADVYFDDMYFHGLQPPYTPVLASMTNLQYDFTDFVEGVHTVRWSGLDADIDRTTLADDLNVIDSTNIADGYSFTLVDDDAVAPVAGTAIGGDPLLISFASSNVTAGSGSGTNRSHFVTDGDLASVGGTNYLFNAQFELGTNGWTVFDAAGAGGFAAESGLTGIYIRAQTGGQGGGLYQDAVVEANVAYEFSMRAKKQANWAAQVLDQKIEFYDASTSLLAGLQFSNRASTLSTDWATFSLTSTSPAGAAFARTVVIQVNGTGAASQYDALFDNFAFEPVTNRPMRLTFSVYDPFSGLSRGQLDNLTNMNVDIGSFVTDEVSHYAPTDSDPDTFATTSTSVWKWAHLNYADIGTLYNGGTSNVVALSAFDADSDRAGDAAIMTNARYGFIQVSDDDSSHPELRTHRFGLGAADKRLHVATNGVSVPVVGITSNTTYTVLDGFLAYLSATQFFQVSVGAKDEGGSGLARGAAGNTNIVMSLSIGTAVTNDFVNYHASTSTPDSLTSDVHATNVWTYTSAFTPQTIQNMFAAGTNNPVRATVPDDDDDRPNDRSTLYSALAGFIEVIDDDDSAPLFGTSLPGSGAMDFLLGSTSYYAAGTGTNVVFAVTDDDLAQISPANPMRFVFNVYDADSEVARNAAAPDDSEDLNYDVGNTPATNIYATFSNELSSSDTTINTATSVFHHVTNFTFGGFVFGDANAGYIPIETGEVASALSAVSNRITVTAPNDDNDRYAEITSLVDKERFTDFQVGYLEVRDEDSSGPNMTLRYAGTNYSFGAVNGLEITDAEIVDNGLDIAYELFDPSGVFMTNNSAAVNIFESYGNVSINWDFITPSAVTQAHDHIHAATSLFAVAGNGSLYATAVEYNVTTIVYTNNETGVWFVSVSAQDHDLDRGTYFVTNTAGEGMDVSWDRALTVNSNMAFTIVDNDSSSPLLGEQYAPTSSFAVFLGSTSVVDVGAFSGTGRIQKVTDGDLAGVSAANPLRVVFNVYDVDSGINRDASDAVADPTTNMNASIENLTTNNVTNFVLSSSSSDTTVNTSTSVWSFLSFDTAQIDTLYGTTGLSHKVSANVPDSDDNRMNDRQVISNQQFGFILTQDDDMGAPFSYGLAFNDQASTTNGGAILVDESLAGTNRLKFHVRLGDVVSGVYTAVPSGVFTPPDYDLMYPSGAFLRSNQAFNVISNDVQPLNRGFEANVGADEGNATNWNQLNLLLRTNRFSHTGTHSLGMDYNGAVDYGETSDQWYDFSDAPTGATFTFGAYVKIVGAMTGGQSLIKFEWWDSTNAGSQHGFELGTFLSDTTNEWLRTEVSGTKTGDQQSFVKLICEVTHIVSDPVTAETYFDDLYVGAPSSVRGEDDSIQVDYFNMELGEYEFRWTGLDADNDRTGDPISVSDETNIVRSGHTFTIIDEDTNAPFANSITVNSGDQLTDADMRFGIWSLNISAVDSNGLQTNAVTSWVPSYNLVDPSGFTSVFQQAFDTIASVDAITWNMTEGSANGLEQSNVLLGTWNIEWSAQDDDDDRDGDRASVTNHRVIVGDSNTFNVVDDDTVDPTSPSNIVLIQTAWTNVNFFEVQWLPGTDASGIFETRVSTNLAQPAQVIDGQVFQDGAITNTIAATLTNADYEVGSDGLLVPDGIGDMTNGWQSFSSSGGRGRWTGSEAQSGSLGMFHSLDEGRTSGGDSRYTLISQDVWIQNSNGLKVLVDFAGYFKGNLAKTNSGSSPTAFMKMEFYDSATQLQLFVSNEYDTDHNGRPGHDIDFVSWSNLLLTATNGPANTEMVRFMTGIAQHDSDLALTGYWDSVSATVRLVSVGGGTLTNALEGTRTNWVFAVDDDDDRLNDRLMSPITSFVTRLDQTAPAMVTITNAEPGPDDQSELLVQWDPLPDGGGADLSPWSTYILYYTDENRDATNTDSSVSVNDSGPADLGTITTRSAIISNLIFDVIYRVTVAGRDEAGNESVLGTSAVVALEGFAVTQGVSFVVGEQQSGATIAWKASTDGTGTVDKAYDLIYVDALSYSDSLTDNWQLVQTVTNSFVVDTGAVGRTPPVGMINTMRFYRAARENRWKLTNEPFPLVSREVYAAKNLLLSNGHNFVSLYVEPDSNTVRGVLGTSLPKSSNSLFATQVTWFDSSTNAQATNVIWLSDLNVWLWLVGSNGIADQKTIPSSQGFDINIPSSTGAPPPILVIGKIPSNNIEVVVNAESNGIVHNVLSYSVPRHIRVDELGLESSGFTGGPTRRKSDELRVLKKGLGPFASPRLRVWYNTDKSKWLHYTSGNNANDEIIAPDEAIIIRTRQSESPFVWTNTLYYSAPSRFMDP